MSVFKCKMCGGTLEFAPGNTVGVCDSCGTKQTLPKTNDDVIANLFNRANNLRLKCEFDKAEQIYEKIVEQNAEDCEAHWGIVLCKYGIEYVEDPKTLSRVPTCHRTLFEAVTTDADYLAAIANADDAQKEIYQNEAREIDKIQKNILAIVKNEKPFDVFICYKETDENGKRTVDSTVANDIYYQLTKEGLKVFYAAITLENKLGQEYEPYIFAALNSAKVMLVIGTKPEYFEAVWVKNEWSRFLNLMKTDRNKLLIPCYRDMDAYDLPEAFAHLQAQDMGKIGFINDLIHGIKKMTKTESAAAPQSETAPSAGNITPLLKRAKMCLEDGEWQKADDFCEQVLNQDPECAEAYLYKLMAEQHARNREDLPDLALPFDNSNYYEKIQRFGDDALKKEISGYVAHIKERNEYDAKEKAYNLAVAQMKAARTEVEYTEAADIFGKIPEHRDAAQLKNECLKGAEKIKNERLKREEKERIEAEKRAKNVIKAFAIGTPIVCAFIAFLVLLNTVIIPKQKYDKALEFIDSGDYELAYELLKGLSYKDSDEKLLSIKPEYIQFLMRKAEVGSIVPLGSYEQDNDTSNGKEDIEWKVLAKENNRVLLISEKALDCKRYNTSFDPVTWENCSLRKWLNETFLNNAFSAEEQALIQSTTVSADKNPDYSTNPGNATTDKVFLLSITEAEKYFDSDEARRCAPTAYAIAQGVWTSDSYKTADGDAVCWWWLRSPGNDECRATYVRSSDGAVYLYGDYVYYVSGCVRPAIWVHLNA